MKVVIKFHKLFQNVQELGTNDDYLISRAYFTIETSVRKYENLYADIKQTNGSKFNQDSFEISIQNYNGPIDYEAIRDEIEKYYRQAIGPQGNKINLPNNVRNVRMENNTIIMEKNVILEVPNDKNASW